LEIILRTAPQECKSFIQKIPYGN